MKTIIMACLVLIIYVTSGLFISCVASNDNDDYGYEERIELNKWGYDEGKLIIEYADSYLIVYVYYFPSGSSVRLFLNRNGGIMK